MKVMPVTVAEAMTVTAMAMVMVVCPGRPAAGRDAKNPKRRHHDRLHLQIPLKTLRGREQSDSPRIRRSLAEDPSIPAPRHRKLGDQRAVRQFPDASKPVDEYSTRDAEPESRIYKNKSRSVVLMFLFAASVRATAAGSPAGMR